MVKVSIVIPVYNRKNFLTVCIISLIAQSFEDFEICLVDDGSTDVPFVWLLTGSDWFPSGLPAEPFPDAAVLYESAG